MQQEAAKQNTRDAVETARAALKLRDDKIEMTVHMLKALQDKQDHDMEKMTGLLDYMQQFQRNQRELNRGD